MDKYATLSIELHLFFSRIMKEHALFLEAGFSSKDKIFVEEASWYKNEFEKFLVDVIRVSDGGIRPNILNSGEIVTDYTLGAENKTECLTGITINKNITISEKNMQLRMNYKNKIVTDYDVKNLNNRAIELLDGLIGFKERLLSDVLTCHIFTANYPLLIDHILREAKLYRSYVIALEKGQDIDFGDTKQIELFWNQIMMEHALFIRGLLDPTENDLINTADNFVNEYNALLEEAKKMTDVTIASITNKTFQETLKYKEFKTTGAKGLSNCEIKSIILPLLADHVLREANHYLRVLKDQVSR